MSISSQNWVSNADLRPPPPDRISIEGEVQMPTPGFRLRLERDPSRIFIPNDYRVILIVEKLDGIWPEVLTWFTVSYSAQDMANSFVDAVILEDGNQIGRVLINKVE